MALDLESLMKLCKEVLAGIVLDYKDKFDTTLMNINKELTDLRNKFTILVKHRYWTSEQYSRTECLEISDVPHNISQNDLESKVCDIFRECDSDIDPVNTEACDRLKSNHWTNEVIVKLATKNDASKILRGKNKLKTTDPSKKGFPPNTIVFINESLCSHYRFLCSECKKLWSKKSIEK